MAKKKETIGEAAPHLERMEATLSDDADDESGTEISVDDDDEEDPIDVAPQDRGPSRREKRANRFREAKEEAERAQQARIDAERNAAAATERARLLEGALQHANQQRQQQVVQEDPEIDNALREQDNIAAEFQARQLDRHRPITTDEHKEFIRRARINEGRLQEARTRKVLRESGIRPQPNQIEQAIMARHSDVFANPSAANWAQARRNQKLAEGRPDTMDTLDESMEEARRQFKIGRQREESELRDRLGGAPRGGAVQRSETGRRTVKMTKTFKKMADAKFPHIKNDMERYKAWAKMYAVSDDDT
jgi:hypothetical protein